MRRDVAVEAFEYASYFFAYTGHREATSTLRNRIADNCGHVESFESKSKFANTVLVS